MAFGHGSSSSNKAAIAWRIFIDFLCVASASVAVLLLKYGDVMDTFQRGFFCDDESIQHPYKSDTVPMTVVICVGLITNVVVIFFTEMALRNGGNSFMVPKDPKTRRFNTWYGIAYAAIFAFLFGTATSQFTNELAKRSIGRLRPHFLDVCAPDYSKFNCSDGYITEDVCTRDLDHKMKNARLSCPSGHSCLGMYCMWYLFLYIHCRVSLKKAFFVKPLILVVLFCLTFYLCLSRISDYKHHWSDVLFGAILGSGFAFSVVLALTDFGKLLWRKHSASAEVLPYQKTQAVAQALDSPPSNDNSQLPEVYKNSTPMEERF